jgi:hypothetical protein
MIEINSTENAVIDSCVFDGPSYTFIHENLLNEEIQLDLAREGSYGPVYNCDGALIDFCKDDTVCSNVTISDNIFKCAGFPAIGHHGEGDHHNILIENNIFDGKSGLDNISRGYVIFKPAVYDVKIKKNIFISPKTTDSPNYSIIFENPNSDELLTESNVFIGKITSPED